MDVSSNHEIINATQNAVINAVDTVANAIETTALESVSHHGPFYLSAEFWVAMSFMLVVVGLTYPITKLARKMLKKRSRLIAKRIEDATNLKEDAQKLLAEYERKYRRAKQEAQEILQRSEREVLLLRKESLNKLENAMKTRERDAKARIDAAQSKAIKEVANITVTRTVKTVKKVLSEVMTDKDYSRLIDASIAELEKVKF
ncbi:MAG: F0F1 ATP synthase subunit B [Alphaproteobacteria bacterium]|nr:F0F1 ATP synthase subunit B [Alphaproteobacteria bacterium]